MARPDERPRWNTGQRIGYLLWVLVGLLVAIVVVPAAISILGERFTERALPPYAGVADLPGQPRYRLFDYDDDGRVDCLLRMPATPWNRQGFRAGAPGRRCRGERVAEMPAELGPLLDELLALRRSLQFPYGFVEDVNGDGRADCLISDGTWRFAPEADCQSRRSDARAFTEDEGRAADRLFELERTIRSRWLEAGLSSRSVSPPQPRRPLTTGSCQTA